jgi:hypothetical protein
MRRSRPFLVALAISFALHLLAISGPGWNLPTLDELLAPDDEPPLEARLMAQPGPPAVQPKRARPKRAPAGDRKSTRLNSSHNPAARMPSSA